ncbi:ABC transporter ATP-binding protein [Virgibacillus dokdonensis]|uniref:ABC transporter ATP-binding protein n=1 Tax=Virgibacillus dokdonensis TaxID=302167 RepID=UPI00098A8203|nr:ATP-binding cassette domain-containing protein [Virgibacillus dokdonensis]
MVAIETKELEQAYKNKGGTFYALKDLNLNINKGKVFCLLGPNGSGKTTTINLINGLNRPTAGNVKVLGLDPIKDMKKVRRLISVVPQETALYNDLSARENLLFHAQYYGLEKSKWHKYSDEVLDLVGLTKRQYDRVGTYSGGMQRRLSLARALITEPEIILLDEPTLGVDVQSRNSIWNHIREFVSEGKTVLLTTNNMEEAEYLADEIMIIDHGEEVVHGTPQSLKEKIHQNLLVFRFDSGQSAQTAYEYLHAYYETKVDQMTVQVTIPDKDSHFDIMKRVEPLSDVMGSFEMREPTLNDVFLHFTGRQLRN